jgi:Tetratricopeptide repeat
VRPPLALALAAVAVLVAAFFAARLYDHDRCQDTRRELFAAGLLERGAPAGAVARVRESCPGTTALVAVADSLHAQGRDAEAAALAREATREEPGNAAAWRALAQTAQAPAEARAAARRLSELDPLGARSLNRSSGRSTR